MKREKNHAICCYIDESGKYYTEVNQEGRDMGRPLSYVGEI